MTSVIVTGYASLDHVLELQTPLGADTTSLVRTRLPSAWPRAGGSPVYIADAIQQSSAQAQPASIVSWVGDDTLGSQYITELLSRDLSVDGVERCHNSATPIALLAYGPLGECHCIYDPAATDRAALGVYQRTLIAQADWVCIAIGPAQASAAALQAVSAQARLVWAVKNDPGSLPPSLQQALAVRADVICHSEKETAFVDAALAACPPNPRRLRVQTHGMRGVSASFDGRHFEARCTPLPCPDPTGAGDSFVGGLIAALIHNADDVGAALAGGIKAATELLLSRQSDSDLLYPINTP